MARTQSGTQRTQASLVSKTYRQATRLFLTRRLPEALSTLELVINPQHDERINDYKRYICDSDSDETECGNKIGNAVEHAPVALAARSIRIKVWCLYLAMLDAVIALGPDEGKHTLGSSRWKSLAAQACDSTIWDLILRVGYGGIEANMDDEVVINL